MAGFTHLFIPGPTNIPEQVRQAMNLPMEDMRASSFPNLTLPLFEDIKRVFKNETGRVFIYPSSGTGAWEAAMTNVLSPGDKVLMSRFGQFSHLWVDMAERLGFGITVPIYPIAPEHDFHDMFGMVGDVYRRMLEDTEAEDIVFMGDSAGGNMAVVLTMMAAEEGLPSPSRHVLISPGLDMSLSNPEVFEAERNDPWLGIPGGLEAIRLYSAGFERSDWHISPLYGDLSVLPKTLLLTGSRDLLSPDNLIFAERARIAGVEVDVVYEEGMFHVWPLIEMPEARRARDSIVAFLNIAPAARKARARRRTKAAFAERSAPAAE
ncbi:MAG: steryl acetyl hydrolase [Mesorhizobium sp.]|nr:MAG: steryl acetyl hydrolase [Mesorhizobium sp.]